MSRDGDGETRPRRARLDLGHGFLRAIERNQRDRAAYHAAWEERRESDADPNRRATGMGVTVIKDGEEWKDPQPWRSFDRDGTGGERQTARRSGGSSESAGGSASASASASAARARRARDPDAAPARAPESESLDEFAEWWGATGGDDARRGVRDAKAHDAARAKASHARRRARREPNENASEGTRRAVPEPVDQTRTKPKPKAEAEAEAEQCTDDHHPASSSSSSSSVPPPSKLSAHSKAFEPTTSPPDPPPDPLDEWSALDEELEKALASTKGSRGSGRGGRRR